MRIDEAGMDPLNGGALTAKESADGAVALSLYECMARIKQVDDRFVRMLSSGQIFHPYYSPRGQEAISAGVVQGLRQDDLVVTTYRGLHDTIAKGVPLRSIWAEYLGRSTGTCKGKGGPMHITHPESGLMVTTGIVGAGIPIANGLALAQVMTGGDKVVVCNFGDGATNIGAFHEGLNLASIWMLPVVLVCQNNQWGEHTAYPRTTASDSVALRARAYRIPASTIDGNDPEEVWTAVSEATERARAGGGPTLIEAMTFRFRGHTNGDDSSYIPRDEFDAALALDPIPRYRKHIIDGGLATEEQLKKLEDQIDDEVEDAVQYALASPYPDPEKDLLTDVYSEAS
jgi:TPP-dependent pyruvate/acetoin dehydrogenase alpha subunit